MLTPDLGVVSSNPMTGILLTLKKKKAKNLITWAQLLNRDDRKKSQKTLRQKLMKLKNREKKRLKELTRAIVTCWTASNCLRFKPLVLLRRGKINW